MFKGWFIAVVIIVWVFMGLFVLRTWLKSKNK